MEIRTWNDRLYGKLSSHRFVWEESWDNFRPIAGVGWNGNRWIEIELSKSNLLDPLYGYGSAEMKALCNKLADTVELESAKPIGSWLEFWKWFEQTPEWWRDRSIVFSHSCVSRDVKAWKEHCGKSGIRMRTLRHGSIRKTRRLLPR